MGWGQGGRSSKPPWGHILLCWWWKMQLLPTKLLPPQTDDQWITFVTSRCLNCYIAPAVGREGNRWPERELKFTVFVNLWSNRGWFLSWKRQFYLEKQLLFTWTQTCKLNNPEMEKLFKIQKVGTSWPLSPSVFREWSNIHYDHYGNLWKHLKKPNIMQYNSYKSKHRKFQVSTAWAWIVLSKHKKE